MAQTRGTTGNSKPRIFSAISTAPGQKRTGTKKRKTGTTTTGGVKKTSAPRKRKTSTKTKLSGIGDKIAGKVERKPGKKAAGTKKLHGTTGTGGAKKARGGGAKKVTTTTTVTT